MKVKQRKENAFQNGTQIKCKITKTHIQKKNHTHPHLDLHMQVQKSITGISSAKRKSNQFQITKKRNDLERERIRMQQQKIRGLPKKK